ncbi:hypothetical protein ACPV36_07305 [Photobacterium damselae]
MDLWAAMKKWRDGTALQEKLCLSPRRNTKHLKLKGSVHILEENGHSID